jgi:hypothetical protein
MRTHLWYFVVLTAVVIAWAPAALAVPAPHNPHSGSGQPDFGTNVLVFDPSMSTSQIQTAVDAVANQQVDDEMGSQRFALLFMPGTYGTPDAPLDFQVGYYTDVAGLGASPTDVVINGHVDVFNRCLTPSNCIALVNFWRSLSNLTINVKGLSGCRSSANFWAVSQAAPLRRVKITGGNLSFMDYCSAGPQFASGGFMSDSETGFITNGSQQQFLVRDSSITGWSNGVWNQVFSGVLGAPPQSFGDTPSNPPPYTTLPTSPVTREKPFLYVDSAGHYNVFVPATRSDSSGTTWSSGPTSGKSIPIERFFIAKPDDSAKEINVALATGHNLILTPGIYHLDRTIKVKRRDAVVLGLGFPTLVPDNGVVAMSVADVAGVKLAGLLFDAGPVNSPVLLQIGTPHTHKRDRDESLLDAGSVNSPTTLQADTPDEHKSDRANPTLLSDVFFRIGGAGAGMATTSLVVNSDNVLLDDIWAWRADHGTGVGWTINTADTGLIVNGDNVIAYGLFVEHYQKYEVIWNGENGRTIMFQNEMPYDPPNQAAWAHDDVNGFAAYKVADSVHTHQGWGLGSYCFFRVDPTIHAAHALEVPNAPGLMLHDLLTVSLSGTGVIDHVVNDTGAAAQGPGTVPVNLVSYP